MPKPIVAIVGKPNVGKSTFFNRLAGRKISIVEDKPGVTRDRIYADTEWASKPFTIVDTGGLELKATDIFLKHIKTQVEIAIETADVIIFFTDVKTGVTGHDEEVAERLRKSGKPIVLAVNKMDNYKEELLYDFYTLGLGTPIGISSEQGMGTGDVLDEVVSYFKDYDYEKKEGEPLKIAVVGKPNAGKSSIVNKLLGYERTIVSNIAGTTRDAIDTEIEYGGKRYILIDTAGIRKKKNVEEDVEYYSVVRALGAIRRADVCIAVIDASEGITEQDVKICGYIDEQGKPSVILMNKWDLIEKDTHTINEFNEKLQVELSFMDYFKSMYVSAKTGQRIEKIFEMADKVYERNSYRIGTGLLNDVITDAVRLVTPPSYNGKRLKIYYSVQAEVNPPTFIIFANDSSLVHFSYKRYLENCIRKAFDFSGTPIRIFIRNQNEDEGIRR